MAYSLQILALGDLSAVRMKVLGEDNTVTVPQDAIVTESVAGLAEELVKDRVPDYATILVSGSTRNRTLLKAATVAAMAAVLSPMFPPIKQDSFAGVSTGYSVEPVEARTARLLAERDLAVGGITTQAALTDHLIAVKSIDYEAIGAPQVYKGDDIV